jgi:hypothetical protein
VCYNCRQPGHFIGNCPNLQHLDHNLGELSVLTARTQFFKGSQMSHPIFRRKPGAHLYACQDQVSCI